MEDAVDPFQRFANIDYEMLQLNRKCDDFKKQQKSFDGVIETMKEKQTRIEAEHYDKIRKLEEEKKKIEEAIEEERKELGASSAT